MPRKDKRLNHALGRLITEAGFSNKGLADRVNRLGKHRGAPDLRYNHSSVTRWLRGEHPRNPVPQVIAEVFAIELGRPIDVTEIGMKAHKVPADVGLELPTTQPGSARITGMLWKADNEQERRLVDSGFDQAAFTAAALRWLVGPWDPTPVQGAGRRIGTADVEEVREVTHAFRVLDNRLGGGHVRVPVVEYLHTHVGPMLREGRCTEEVRRQLFSAAADLTKVAAWLYHDLDKQGLAQRYLIQALAMAKFAGDLPLGAEILAAMSQQSLYVAQPARAVDLARAAQSAAQRVAIPVLMTECHVMEARGYAAQNESRACTHALTRAERTFDRAADAATPAWLHYFDEAYFAAKLAHCFRDLDSPEKAEEYATRSLRMDPTYQRGKAFNTAVLSMALAAQGRIDEACSRGRSAIDLAAGLTSARVYRYIRNVNRSLESHADEPIVRDLREYAAERLPALRSHAERP
ncbi:hypothetical protein [Actinomadura sediminis]|uniref:Sporulation protein n=1 Tax=Actinomadura sediminis TaxID=1038904 RepID=A0ABW3ET43_9ACTN